MLRPRHPSFEQLRAFAVHELEPTRRARVTGHLGTCSTCRNAVGTIRLVISVAAETDAPLPAGALDRIRARRSAGERTILPAGDGGDGGESRVANAPDGWRRRSVMVAVLSLGVAGTAAAFVTGPVRQLLREWQRQSAAAPAPKTTTTAVAPGPAADSSDPVTPTSGVSLPVTSQELWVSVEGADPSLRIRFRLTDGSDVEVRGTGSAAAAVFSPRGNGIGVSNAGPGELHVDVPRAAQRFVLRVDGVPYIAKTGAELRVLSTTVDTTGSDLVLTPSRRRGDRVAAPSQQR